MQRQLLALYSHLVSSPHSVRIWIRPEPLQNRLRKKINHRFKVFRDDAPDGLYSDEEARARLEDVLRVILMTPNLKMMVGEQVGWRIIIGIQFHPNYRAETDNVHILSAQEQEAKANFCRLSSEPWSLFSKDISETICKGEKGPEDIKDLLQVKKGR